MSIYLDNNATTLVSPSVVSVVHEVLREVYGNPSSLHHAGTQSALRLEKARKMIASVVRCFPEEIIFTSSGSEANNLALTGIALSYKAKGRHIITSAIEHPSVTQPLQSLTKDGYEITTLSVDREGVVNSEELRNAIRPDTVLVSIMAANNEIGALQPIDEIAQICAERNVFFHSDMVQSFGKMPINLATSPIHLASFSGHKIHAPKGIGFLFKRKGIALTPLIRGGSQEFGLRAGTENIAYIVGLSQAVSEISADESDRMRLMQQYLISELEKFPSVRINGPKDLNKRICTNVNISVRHQEGERLLHELSKRGVFVSTGSACSSKSTKLSPVLRAIQCPVEFIHGNLRLSISRYTTMQELADFFVAFSEIIRGPIHINSRALEESRIQT